MNRLIRMTYGHGGSRTERIVVAVPPPDNAPAPRWLKALLLAVWVTIPVLISIYAIPTATHLATIIDVSKLELKPPPEPEPPARPRVKPVEPLPEPTPPQPQAAPKTPEKPLPEEAKRPAIVRPTAPRAPELQEYQPRIAREHLRPGSLAAVPSEARIRREAAVSETPVAERTRINRTRGAAGADAPAAGERVAPLHRRASTEGTAGGMAVGPRQVVRRERVSGGPSGTGEAGVSHAPVSRGRAQIGGTGANEGPGSASVSIRGISLMSLDVCASPRMEEDAIKAVLGVVGDRESCTDRKGRFDFRGTQRISSFNLMIHPANGRKPTNRCEELENAYRCLKNR